MAIQLRILRAGGEHILNNVAAGVFDYRLDDTLRAEVLRDPRHHLCVGIEDGTVAGFASAVHYIHPDKAPQLWINEVGVSPLHQRRGIAKTVLKALLNLGLELGCSEAWGSDRRQQRCGKGAISICWWGGERPNHGLVSTDEVTA